MRRLLPILVCFGGIIFGVNLAAAVNTKPDVTVKVKGMVCSFCAQGIEKKLLQDASVARVAINLEVKTVEVWLKANRTLSDDEIKRAINSAGYNIDSIERPTPTHPQPPPKKMGEAASPTSP